MASAFEKIRKKGFVGPNYVGAKGKARMAFEKWIFRHDVVSVATPTSFASASPVPGPPIELALLGSASDLSPFEPEFEREYYTGYLDSWRPAFDWGERLVLGTAKGRVLGFYWIELGSVSGRGCYHSVLFEGEARIFRAGVPPSQRRKGIYTRLTRGVLAHLFGTGIRRVYVECSIGNTASLHAHVRAGFRPVGCVDVVGSLSLIRWRSPVSIIHALEAEGLRIPALGQESHDN